MSVWSRSGRVCGWIDIMPGRCWIWSSPLWTASELWAPPPCKMGLGICICDVPGFLQVNKNMAIRISVPSAFSEFRPTDRLILSILLRDRWGNLYTGTGWELTSPCMDKYMSDNRTCQMRLHYSVGFVKFPTLNWGCMPLHGLNPIP